MSWSRHLIDVEGLSAQDLDFFLAEARSVQAGSLRNKSVALLFSEASTRTRFSFELAARRLAADTFVLDPGSSSMTKGETFVDTVRNLDAIGFDFLVVRHHRSGAAAVAARHFSGHVVNAGDGWHAHPTQALLDLVTLMNEFGSLSGRKVAIVGDVRHSRVARSNAHALTTSGASVFMCGPREWLRGAEALPVTLTSDLDAALRDADAVMGLRVQRERMARGLSLDDYVARYQITDERLRVAKPDAIFMHPGPINEGIEVTRSVALGPRSRVMEQVRNGVPTRMAVLAILDSVPADPAQATAATRDLSSVRR